jgi:hypothetical protein
MFTTDGSMVQFSTAGYDSRVAGIDEVSARSVLAEMQERLASDPMTALGITPSASAEDVRAAFLALTKQYHPVRFGRMAADIQKLSNEVFLALRAAHDTAAKNLRKRSGPIPTTRAQPASGPTVAPLAAALPTAQAQPGRIVQQPPPKLARPNAGNAANERTERSPGRHAGGAVGPEQRSEGRSENNDTGERPATPAVPPTPSAASSGTKAAVRTVGAQPTGPTPARPAPRAAAAAPAAAVRDEAGVLDLLQRQQWDPAKTALHQLSARDPGSKRLRALMCYARGREAQLSGLVDDARVELQDALDLDPELQLAKTALTELFTRRK